jgi:hypothetical protein
VFTVVRDAKSYLTILAAKGKNVSAASATISLMMWKL